MLRTMIRELIIRWVNLQHQSWYNTFVSDIFLTKRNMRRELSLSDKLWGFRSVYIIVFRTSLGGMH